VRWLAPNHHREGRAGARTRPSYPQSAYSGRAMLLCAPCSVWRGPRHRLVVHVGNCERNDARAMPLCIFCLCLLLSLVYPSPCIVFSTAFVPPPPPPPHPHLPCPRVPKDERAEKKKKVQTSNKRTRKKKNWTDCLISNKTVRLGFSPTR